MSRIKSPVSQDGRHTFQASRYIFHAAHHVLGGEAQFPSPDSTTRPSSLQSGWPSSPIQPIPMHPSRNSNLSILHGRSTRRRFYPPPGRYGFPGFFTKKNDNHPRIQGFRELLAPNSMLGTPGAHSGLQKKTTILVTGVSHCHVLQQGGRRWCCNRTC